MNLEEIHSLLIEVENLKAQMVTVKLTELKGTM